MTINFLHNLQSIPLTLTGKQVAFKGRVKSVRDLGKLVFFIIEDAFSQIQVTCSGEILQRDVQISLETTLSGIAELRFREKEKVDPKTFNGNIELIAISCFLEEDRDTSDRLLVKKHTLSLRESVLDKFLKLQRSLSITKRTLLSHGFIEIDADAMMSEYIKIASEEKDTALKNTDRSSLINQCLINKFFYVDSVSSSTKEKASGYSVYINFNTSSLKELKALTIEILQLLFQHNKLIISDEIYSFDYQESISTYGTIAPDLRYDNKIVDIRSLFDDSNLIDKNYSYSWFIGAPLQNYDNLAIINEIEQAVFGQPNISFTWGISDKKGEFSGPLKKYLSSSFIRELHKKGLISKNTLVFLFIGKNEDDILTVGHLLRLINEASAMMKESKSAACWVNSSPCLLDHQLSTQQSSYLIYNGKKIADCNLLFYKALNIYSTKPHDIFNFGQGTIRINLSALLELSDSTFQKETTNLDDLGNRQNDKKTTPMFLHENYLNKISKNPIFTIETLVKEIETTERKEISILFNKSLNSLKYSQSQYKELKIVLAKFSMSWDDAQYLLDLIPSLQEHILNLSKEEQFQFFWSILGHPYVQDMLKCQESKNTLEFLCNYKIVTEHRQILYLQRNTLDDIKTIIQSYIDGPLLPNMKNIKNKCFYESVKLLRTVIGSSPNNFSNFVVYFISFLKNGKNFNLKQIQQKITQALENGFTTPSLIDYFINNINDTSSLRSIRYTLNSFADILFTNTPITDEILYEKIYKNLEKHYLYPTLDKKMLLAELIYYFFNPINMDVRAIYEILTKLKDCSDHFHLSSIKFGGENWDVLSESFQFIKENSLQQNNRVQVFPSKNIASFFAKASAGICTARDLILFHSTNHFHLNLLNPFEKKIIGNTQIYLIQENNKNMFLLRGLNPSSSFVNLENCSFLVDSILLSAIQIAIHSDIDSVLLCPSLGIWRAESSRIEIIAVLKKLTQNLPLQPLAEPFFLFHFGGQDKMINYAFRVWDRRQGFSIESNFKEQAI